jgi:hypothetical protein
MTRVSSVKWFAFVLSRLAAKRPDHQARLKISICGWRSHRHGSQSSQRHA